jgi:hypothetical protein
MYREMTLLHILGKYDKGSRTAQNSAPISQGRSRPAGRTIGEGALGVDGSLANSSR